MNNIRTLLEKLDQFAGQAVGQKPGDQVRGIEKANTGGKDHPFKGRLVGASESILKELTQELNKPASVVKRDLFREFAEFKQGTSEQVTEVISDYNYDKSAEWIVTYRIWGSNREVPLSIEKKTIIADTPDDVKKFVYKYLSRDIVSIEPKSSISEDDPCWKGYHQVGMKKKGGRQVPNCVPNEGVDEDEGDSEGLPHLTRELASHIRDQIDTEGPHAICKSVEWGDGAATELTELIKMALEKFIGESELNEGMNPQDTVKMDVPLLIRIMEYAKEDAKTDMDLHNVAEKLISLCSSGATLSMDQYDDIVGEKLDEYGAVGAYGAASQAPQGSTTPDPAQQQSQMDKAQIAKSTNALKGTLNSQGAATGIDTTKFQDVMNKLDTAPNTALGASDTAQLGPLAVAASKALQDPSTAGQLKQVISRADQIDKTKQAAVKQKQQQMGTTSTPVQQAANKPPVPGQT